MTSQKDFNMSTKIYNGWRLNPNQVNSFLAEVEEKMFVQLKQRMKQLMNSVKYEYVKQKLKEYDKDKDKDIELTERYIRFEYVKQMQHKMHKESSSSLFNIQCGVCMFFSGKKIYAYSWGVFQDIELSPQFEEYSYWDNTDEPEHISRRSWTIRGKNWDKALDQHRLTYDVYHPDDYMSQGKLDIAIFP